MSPEVFLHVVDLFSPITVGAQEDDVFTGNFVTVYTNN